MSMAALDNRVIAQVLIVGRVHYNGRDEGIFSLRVVVKASLYWQLLQKT
jgi:hypothetical protein